MKTWIVTHGDGDGVTSGALALAVYKDAEVFFSHPAGLYEDLLEITKKNSIGRVVICDIALCEKRLQDLIRLFEKLGKNIEIIYIDHHPEPLQIPLKELPITVFHSENACAAELTYKFFEDRLPWDLTRVALYGAICDYITDTEFFKNTLKEWDQRMIFFEAGVLAQGLEGSRGQYDFKRHIVKHLSDNGLPSSLSELLIKALIETMNEEEMRRELYNQIVCMNNIAYVINPRGSVARAANYVRVISKKIVGIAMEEKKGFMVMSLRTAHEKIDLNSLLRKLAVKYNGTGGGHKKAAGARIPKEFLNDFLNELDKEINFILG